MLEGHLSSVISNNALGRNRACGAGSSPCFWILGLTLPLRFGMVYQLQFQTRRVGDELRKKDMASSSAAPNNSQQPSTNHSKTKEEGELSSSDDELPAGSSAHSRGTMAPAVPAEPIAVAAVNKHAQGIKAVQFVPAVNHASFIHYHSKASVQPNYHMSIEKNRAGWSGPLVVDDNLVICFGNDSDSDESRQERALGTTGNAPGVNGNRKPPAQKQTKLEMAQQARRNETKVLPKKASLGRPVMTSVTKFNGTSSRSAGPSLVEQRSRARNFNTRKNLAVQEHGPKHAMNLSNNKLQDLRQQIAMRENELKLKFAQQNKDTAFCKDYNVVNSNSDAARKSRAISADIVHSELKEPDEKRIKVSEPYPTQLSFNVHQEKPAAKSISTAKDPVLEKSNFQNMNSVDHSCNDIEILRHTKQSSIVKWQKQGCDITTSFSPYERASTLPDSLDLNQTAPSENATSRTLLTKSSPMEECNSSKITGHTPSSSIPKRAACGHSSLQKSENCEITFEDKTLELSSENTCQICAPCVPDSNLEMPDASLNTNSFWNYFDKVNISGVGNIDLRSLLETEELLDKKLEEAQEHRHRCEIDERNTLKAYRKAQRALVEANARCSYLYQQRELYSVQLRSFIMGDSSLLWSSGQQNHVGVGLNSSNTASEVDADLVPTRPQPQAEFGIYNQPGYHSNVQFASGDLVIMADRNMDGQTLGSEACSDPDASTSELPQKVSDVANDVCSPSNDQNTSVDEDEETFSVGHISVKPNLDSQKMDKDYKEREDDTNVDSKRGVENSPNSLFLEASLRSKLFERLGKISLSKKCDHAEKLESTLDRGFENGDGNEKSEMSMGKTPLYEAEQSQHFNQGEETGFSMREDHLSATSISASIVMSAFDHMKMMSPIGLTDSHNRDYTNGTYDIYSAESIDVHSDKSQPSSLEVSSMQENVRGLVVGIESNSCKSSIDSFWPLCVYELRGKCNDEECPWQHVKDYSNREFNQLDDTSKANCRAGSLSHEGKFNVWSVECCWIRCFSASLALSSLFRKDLHSDKPFLHGNYGRIEVRDSWNSQSLSLHCQNRHGEVNRLDQGLGDVDQILEVALYDLNQETNKQEGMRKALCKLSRALEADPTSAILWIVYLHIFYSDKKSIGKNDMFFYAIKHNEGSYELWLMYINSRLQLDDRLVAYDSALSALCRQASAPGKDVKHASACILDIFLQMIDCFCMSGNVEKAIQKICGLLPSGASTDDSHSLLLSNVLTCLTINDKCIFWVCCVYFVIYRRLPDAIVHQFEFGKDLSAIEWTSVHLVFNEKQRAVALMEMAVDSAASYFDGKSLENENTLRSAHLFALSHIRCVMVLNGLDSSQNLLDKYTKLYPRCLELALLSARAQKPDCMELNFVGFEEALCNWPKDIAGIQCIWNQYVEFVFQNGGFDFAKELMDRWFHSVWKVQYSQDGLSHKTDGDCLLESASASVSASNSNKMDAMFGFLNLSLYRLLQKNHMEARLAVHKALKFAASEDFRLCVREHAMFLRTDGSELIEDASTNGIIRILKGYLVDSRAAPVPEPLSRKFLQNIKKPKVCQLMGNILSPISSNFFLVNLVLGVWYGPSLLPHKFGELKHLVDFVEAVMEISLSNYLLAISVCKLLSRGSKSGEVTPANVLFWASSLLVNAIFQAVPIAPEFVWIEAAGILADLMDTDTISEHFHERALVVYPFSIGLWKSYLNISNRTGSTRAVVAEAKEKGIELD